MRVLLIALLALGLLPAFASMPDEAAGSYSASPAFTPAPTVYPVVITNTPLVTVTEYADHYEVVLKGGKELTQIVFNERGVNPVFKKVIDDYITKRKKWLSAENERALRSFFNWALPNKFIESPPNLDAKFYFILQQGIERLLAQQIYTNRPEFRFPIPKQPAAPPLPELGPLGPGPTFTTITLNEVKAAKPTGYAGCGEIKLPECPTETEETTTVSGGAVAPGASGTYLMGTGPTTERWESTVATAWWSWLNFNRENKVGPCKGVDSPDDPYTPVTPGAWDPNYPTQPGGIGPHPWQPES